MRPKKVTIHFNEVRFAIPCHPEMLVSELIDAAIDRYEKFNHQQICIHYLQCINDQGILTPDDKLFDVFDENNDQILAIYDEAPQNHLETKPNDNKMMFNSGMRSSATVIKVKNNNLPHSNGNAKSEEDEIIEVVSFADPSINVDGLRVVSDAEHSSQPSSSGYSQLSSNELPESRDSLRSNIHKPSISTKMSKSVTYSPDVLKRNITSNRSHSPLTLTSENSSGTNLSRSTARKSMITDAFLDAKERLEERLSKNLSSQTPENMKSFEVALSSEFVGHPLGIEISAVPDPNDSKGNRLLAVEIIRIDEDGRIAKDGRIKVGDQITHINDRPVYQMSLARARAYLHDLRAVDEPTLLIERQQSSSAITNSNAELAALHLKPIITPLQQANTTQLGNTFTSAITKGKQGFGFSVTSRFSAKNERLFYVSTVKLDGPASGSLKIGDRLLQINGQELGELEQHEVVNKLKNFKEGATITILASRIATEAPDTSTSEHAVTKNHNVTTDSIMDTSMKSIRAEMDENWDPLHFTIPLNDSPSAGLGISLKAQKVYKDGLAIDCGLYIKKILHGSAAFKDGRLKKDDRLIGIEDVDLRKYDRNGEALEAFMKCLNSLPPLSSSLNVYVARKRNDEEKQETFVVNRAVFPPTSNIRIPTKGPPLNDEREERLTKSEDESDTASVIPEEPFARDTATRKSMSEKRSFGISNDPFHTQTFLKIKHQRQTSAPLIANVKQNEVPLVIRRSLCGRRCASLSKHRFTLAPETIRIDDNITKRGNANEGQVNNSPKEKNDISLQSATAIKPCLVGRENFTSNSSILANLLHLKGKKNKKDRRQSIFYDGEVAGDDSGKENACQLISASPKRRSASLEPIKANQVGEAHIIPQLPTTSNVLFDPLGQKNRPKVFPAPSFKAAMTNSESQPIITAPRTENGKSGISRSFAENRSSNDKQMRRKSAGNALLKLFRSREGSPEKPSLRVADEEEAYKRNLEEDTRAKNFSENIMYPGPHSSPQMRRNPPPPYRDPRLAYQQQPPSHPPQPHFHQRMYSANETSNSQNYNGKDAFLRYERHRYSGGRLPSAITSIPITYHSHRGRPSGAPTYPTAQPSFPIDEGNRNVPSYQNPLVDREQFATNNTDYYDAFNAWFAYSGRVGSGQSAIAASTAASLSSGSGRSAFSAVNQTRAPPHFNPYSSIQAIEGNGNAYVGNPAAPARQPPTTAAIGQAFRYPPPQGAPTKFATGNQNVHVQLPIHRF